LIYILIATVYILKITMVKGSIQKEHIGV